MRRGDRVELLRGRPKYKEGPREGSTVPVGTVGEVKSTGRSEWGPWAMVKLPDGGMFITQEDNLAPAQTPARASTPARGPTPAGDPMADLLGQFRALRPSDRAAFLSLANAVPNGIAGAPDDLLGQAREATERAEAAAQAAEETNRRQAENAGWMGSMSRSPEATTEREAASAARAERARDIAARNGRPTNVPTLSTLSPTLSGVERFRTLDLD